MIIRGIFSAAYSFTNFTKILSWFTPSHLPMLMNISISLLKNNLDQDNNEILPETDLKTICGLLGLMNDLLDN